MKQKSVACHFSKQHDDIATANVSTPSSTLSKMIGATIWLKNLFYKPKPAFDQLLSRSCILV